MEQGSTRWFHSRKFKWGVVPLLILVAGVAAYIKAFGPDSDIEGEASRIMGVLDLKAGMTVGEVGAGNGKMAVLLAQELGSGGHLFATEIGTDNLDDIRDRVADAGLDIVTVIEAGKKQTNLAPECCDAIFMRKVYHHFTDPAEINASLFEALRPGGVLAVIDFAPGLWNVWLPRPDGVPEKPRRPRHAPGPAYRGVSERRLSARAGDRRMVAVACLWLLRPGPQAKGDYLRIPPSVILLGSSRRSNSSRLRSVSSSATSISLRPSA